MILPSKNMRNELLLNYHKFLKIPETMTTNFKFEISEWGEGTFPPPVPHVGEDGL